MNKRIAATVFMAAQPFVIGLLAGMEFKPGFDLASCYAASAFLGLMTYLCPIWRD